MKKQRDRDSNFRVKIQFPGNIRVRCLELRNSELLNKGQERASGAILTLSRDDDESDFPRAILYYINANSTIPPACFNAEISRISIDRS
jgi:hypothetical protein